MNFTELEISHASGTQRSVSSHTFNLIDDHFDNKMLLIRQSFLLP
jgi:hypothetical protein